MLKITPEKFWRFCKYFGLEKYTRITVPEIKHEGENYIMIEWQEHGFWLPKSEIEVEEDSRETRLRVPVWMVSRMKKVMN